MSHNFSSSIQKQWVDFYLERIQRTCDEQIDRGLTDGDDSALAIIKASIKALEESEAHRYASRVRNLETLKSKLRNLRSSSEFAREDAPPSFGK